MKGLFQWIGFFFIICVILGWAEWERVGYFAK